jgi:HD-GYP domain-containing protein (c-di-GMP phosphodiesterase class II)
MDENQPHAKEVQCTELKEDMVILSYIGFDDKYRQMDPKICRWFQLNFKGCLFTVKRSGGTLEIKADKIETGDELLEIGGFPAPLMKLSIVSGPLIKELEYRGFTRFRVSPLLKPAASKADKIKIATDQANDLVEKVAENIKFREEAAQAIESFIDNARKGVMKEKEIKGFVGELVDKSSTDALVAIASLKKSSQTYGHCVDVSAIFSNVYLKILTQNEKQSAFIDEKELAFASFVHDFGKAKIPKDILETTTRFDINSREMQLMRSHPQYGLELVQKITQSESILNMVLLHHLKMDPTINSSYPKDVEGREVLWETRLLSIVDTYQALIGRRSYKKSWSPAAAVRYLDAMADIEYDLNVWEDFVKIMGQYPVSTLVELSDGSFAFVLKLSQEDTDKPQVVVVKDAQGVAKEKHEILDLSDEPEITIVKDLDAQDLFGDQALEMFTGIRFV